jgi:hypothetical protein
MLCYVCRSSPLFLFTASIFSCSKRHCGSLGTFGITAQCTGSNNKTYLPYQKELGILVACVKKASCHLPSSQEGWGDRIAIVIKLAHLCWQEANYKI